MWPMVSKFNGRCKKCGGRIRQGDSIIWSKSTGALHPECVSQQDDEGGVVCTFCGEPTEEGAREEEGEKVWCAACWGEELAARGRV